jgi:hypothetical protein
MPKFIALGHVRVDSDSIEAYIPSERMIGDVKKFEVHIYRKNLDIYMSLTFSTEQVREECLKHLDSIFKPI